MKGILNKKNFQKAETACTAFMVSNVDSIVLQHDDSHFPGKFEFANSLSVVTLHLFQ